MTAPKAAGAVLHADRATLFRHVTAEKASLYRAILEVFTVAKRQFRIPYLRPDEVMAAATFPQGQVPTEQELQLALSQLVDWGNLAAQPDTARVASIEDFYRARFLYRLSQGGEAVESALVTFEQALRQQGELQSVALEDIQAQLQALQVLGSEDAPDEAKVHEILRDLAGRFTGLAESAQAFMAGIARSIDLQRADTAQLMGYKKRLIEYLERFIGELVARSSRIAQILIELAPAMPELLAIAASRDARDVAPGDPLAGADAYADKCAAWEERWNGLRGWFLGSAQAPAQAELLRARARAAIPQLLNAIAALNERRAGKSDRSADFRVLARWFAECADDGEAHRLWRAAFALSPARHLALRAPEDDVPANRSWANVEPVRIEPKLRERGSLAPRGAPPKVRDRSRERALLAERIAAEQVQAEAAHARLADGVPRRLSELDVLDRYEFRLLLGLLGEAIAAQATPDDEVDRSSQDGLLGIRLEPLPASQRFTLHTELGQFSGRDHRLTLTRGEAR